MLSGIGLTVLAWLTLAGVMIDWFWGEPARWHPLVGFGRLAAALERHLNRLPGSAGSRARGMLGWALAVLPAVALAAVITDWLGQLSFWLAAAWQALLLYFCLGLRSLREHVLPIAQALQDGDLAAARVLTARIVSRDTAQLQETGLARAAIESVLENGNDAVFATLFWFAVAGGPGALLFRLSNTLDAMWGYRTPRLEAYGWAAAKLDDLYNWLPARLTALSYAALGHWRQARACWRTQAPAWSSPNAGPVMAAGAGALGLLLGGAEMYHGQLEQRPPLGVGRAPVAADIGRGWALVARSVCLWLAALLLLAGVAALARASLAAGGMHA